MSKGNMMTYVLILIAFLPVGGLHVQVEGVFKEMNDCFVEREILVEELGRPIMNYQAICVVRTQEA